MRSYHQSKSFAHRRQSRTVLIIVLAVISLGTGLFSLSRLSGLSFFSIDTVRIFVADQNIAANLQAAAYSRLEGDYLHLFSKSNYFLYPRREIIAGIRAASPLIDTVTIGNDGLHTLIISVNEKTPAAVICANLPDFTGNIISTVDSDSCYFADSSGLIFEHTPSITGNVYDRFYVPRLGDAASSSNSIIGTQGIPAADFAKLRLFLDDIHQAGIESQDVLLKDGGEYELYARNPSLTLTGSIPAAQDTVIIYFNDSNLSDELINLVSFWKKMTDTARLKKESLAFDYIDVRYGSNVFYRMAK